MLLTAFLFSCHLSVRAGPDSAPACADDAPPPASAPLLHTEHGDADDLFAIAQSCLSEVEPDPARAARWLRLAAQQDHAKAQLALGILTAEGRGVLRHQVEAADWLRRAAVQGEPQAQ